MNETVKSVRAAFFAGLVFAGLEAAAARVNPVVLDPMPTDLTVVLSVLATGVLLALCAVFLSRISPRHAAGLSMALWAAVWGPHQARIAGWHRVGWAPAIVLGCTAALAPGLALAVGSLGGLTGAAFRRRGGKVGITAIEREDADASLSPSMLLITVDTVRADAGLLQEGRWRADSFYSPIEGWTHFSQAVAPAPWTLPSMHSLMSSRPVREHGGGLPVVGGYSRRISKALPFPYVLQQGGYETLAFVSNPYLSEEQGFADGFDHWSHGADAVEPILLLHVYNRWSARLRGEVSELIQTRDRRLIAAAVDAIRRPSTRPRFVWVHLSSPSDYSRGLFTSTDGVVSAPEDEAAARAQYQANVVATRVAMLGLTRATPDWVVAITSDHGESMGEGGRWGHGSTLSDAELRVPLAIYRPNTQGGVVERPVAVADLGHTLLASAGLARHLPGQNLLSGPERPVEVGGLQADADTFGARTSSGKYIRRSPGVVGPGVHRRDQTEEKLRASGYLD
jgi:hypothetical protein